jgi:potassium channel
MNNIHQFLCLTYLIIFEQTFGADKMHPRRCSVFPFHPWNPKEKRKEGVVLWIPHTVEDLIKSSKEQLNCSGSRLLSEDGACIVDVDMISDRQTVYLVSDTEMTCALDQPN